MENKNEGNRNILILGYLEILIVLRVKWTEMLKIKHKHFIDAVPIMVCQNPFWIMGLRIYGKGRIQIPLSSPAMIGLLARIQDRQGLY